MVEAEVRAYIDLFCADTQPAELAALREVAVGWMQRLAEFRPHLTGAVWRGTATRLTAHAGLELFPKFSPDGKWIIFCKAENYMLLMPDSELFIIPAAGGEARRLRANTPRMNSWHSWSSNGRWLVFSSKANTAYTQLFLTHIDENGESTPPVVLERFTGADRAANIATYNDPNLPLAPNVVEDVARFILEPR